MSTRTNAQIYSRTNRVAQVGGGIVMQNGAHLEMQGGGVKHCHALDASSVAGAVSDKCCFASILFVHIIHNDSIHSLLEAST